MRRLHLLVPALVLACNAPALEPLPETEESASSASGGDAGDSSDSAADPTTHGSSDGAMAMPCDGSCVAPLPDALGWQGPVVLRAASDPDAMPACDGAWDVSMGMAFAEISGAPASCSCECDASAIACPEAVTIEYYDYDSDCSDAPTGSDSITPGCAVVSHYISGGYRLVAPDLVGDCTPMSTTSVPDAVLTGSVALCGSDATASGSCEDGDLCVAAAEGPSCVWRPGEVDCPAGSDYSDRRVLSTNFLDTRTCSLCSCGEAVGSCDVGDMIGYPYSTDCGGSNPVPLSDSTCSISGAGVASVSYPDSSEPLASASCDPTPAEPTGEIVAGEPITVCCTPA